VTGLESNLGKNMMTRILIAVAVLCAAGACATHPPAKDRDLSNRGFRELQAGNYDKAKELLNEALAINPENAFAWLNLGVVHQKLEQYDEARKCYLKVVENAWDETGANKEADGRSLVRMARDNLEKMPSR
jgi:tetratricopeptide (TPR) repeat protein